MAVLIKGLTARGIQIKGREFLTPIQIPGCIVWHQWKTGITTVSNLVSQWDDQSGNNLHLTQSNSARRPAYNATTGLITPSSDWLRCTYTGNVAFPELSFVIEVPVTPSLPIFSKRQNATIDADLLWLGLTSSRYMQKAQAIAGGRDIVPSTPVPASVKCIVTFGTYFYLNGVRYTSYSTRSTSSWVGTSPGYHYIFANIAQASGGVEVTPGQFGNVPIYEWCWHSAPLSDFNRSKLMAYFLTKHGIE